MAISIERQLEGNHNRRMGTEARMLARWDDLSAREDIAEQMLGQLMREGKVVYYVWPQGGKYREGTRLNLIAFLIRNNYA
ncbi:hypothetical protein [Janthinobacterium sp. CAN_S7]|uniref:hypothetical protein n=1 Tax=Janthinobacterium sp. CAN_S7 TaxID=3071704 RepID=UPI00319E00CF